MYNDEKESFKEKPEDIFHDPWKDVDKWMRNDIEEHDRDYHDYMKNEAREYMDLDIDDIMEKEYGYEYENEILLNGDQRDDIFDNYEEDYYTNRNSCEIMTKEDQEEMEKMYMIKFKEEEFFLEQCEKKYKMYDEEMEN